MPATVLASVSSEVKSQFLDGLAPSDRKIILSAARQRRYHQNTVVTHQGEPAEHLFMLMHGRARYFVVAPEGQKILLNWLVPGDVFGGRAFLPHHSSYLLSTETVGDCRVFAWDHATARSLAARFPRLLDNALLIASHYIAWYTAAHVALCCHTAPQRLAHVLINLARMIGEDVPDGVELEATNEELANAASVTHFTASRVMSEWQRNRAVVKRRGKVVLRSPERLFLKLA